MTDQAYMDGKAIVLAAGKGKRLQSELHDLPKVLREADGKPLLGYVLEKLPFLKHDDITIVIGYKGEQVEETAGPSYRYAWQREQLGTGHAVQMAAHEIEDYDGPVLICYGDMPLIRESTYRGLFRRYAEGDCDGVILAYVTELDLPFGRILRDETGKFQEVVEEVDCTPEQLLIRELNAGVYVFRAQSLVSALSRLGNDNKQNEYYLTDVPALIQADGGYIAVAQTSGEYEGIGVNTQEDLDQVSGLLREEKELAGGAQ